MTANLQDDFLKQKDTPVFIEENSRFFKKFRDVPLLRAGKGIFETSTPRANALKFPFSTPQHCSLINIRIRQQQKRQQTPGSKEG